MMVVGRDGDIGRTRDLSGDLNRIMVLGRDGDIGRMRDLVGDGELSRDIGRMRDLGLAGDLGRAGVVNIQEVHAAAGTAPCISQGRKGVNRMSSSTEMVTQK